MKQQNPAQSLGEPQGERDGEAGRLAVGTAGLPESPGAAGGATAGFAMDELLVGDNKGVKELGGSSTDVSVLLGAKTSQLPKYMDSE